MIVATAPGRCTLAGAPSDLFGGSVLACATQERARCTLTPGADSITLSASGHTQVIETPADLVLDADASLNIARAVLAALEVTPGQAPPFRLSTQTEIPRSSGLAGHAALLAAVTGCVLAYLELSLDPYEVSELIRKIDCDVLGNVCGFQDHYMAVFGGLYFLDFRDKDSGRPQEPPAPFAAAEALKRYTEDLPFVLARRPNAQGLGAGGARLRLRWQAGEPAVVDGIMEIASLARRSKRALLARDWDVLAAFMNRGQTLLRDLSGSDADDDALVAAALAGGASGAKMAGVDGSAVLALTTDRERTVQALQEAGAVLLHDPSPGPGLTVSVEVTV